MSFIVAKTRINFGYSLLTRINFGAGAVASLAGEAKNLGMSKVLVVTDKFLMGTDAVKAIITNLDNAGLHPTVYDEVQPDPTDTIVDNGVEVYLKAKCDGIIAIGGGSHMDTLKAIGAVACNGGKVGQYLYDASPGPAPLTKVPPTICIPTTAGTGAEVTCISVITQTGENTHKTAILSPLVAPSVALIDPALTVSLPPLQTACTGIDALSHAIEGYLSILENPITDAYALYALELISNNLRKAVYNGADLEARTNMSLAAMLGGLVINVCMAIGGHSAGQTLGGKYHAPHGMTIAWVLPGVLRHNLPVSMEKLSKVAAAMGVKTQCMSQREAACAAIEEVEKLIADLNIPSLSKTTGMTAADVDAMAQACVLDACSQLNPRPCPAESYAEIYKSALGLA